MWTPLEFLIGSWQGTGSGEPGIGNYDRSYEFILNSHFIYVRNRSVYPPREPGSTGEVHEDWGFFSFDKRRKTFVYRQFHVEGFVNQYFLDHISPDGMQLSFQSEAIENIAEGWRARETYRIISPDEFTETFELAAPGQDFAVYTQCRLQRLSPPVI